VRTARRTRAIRATEADLRHGRRLLLLRCEADAARCCKRVKGAANADRVEMAPLPLHRLPGGVAASGEANVEAVTG
jgi:hypothetical protein